MKRLNIIALIAGLFMSSHLSEAQITFVQSDKFPSNVLVHLTNLASANLTDQDQRLPFILPEYFIYPDSPVSAEEASSLVAGLGLSGSLANYTGSVFVINPSSGNEYDGEVDFMVYEQLFNSLRVFVNLKVVGIGKGATFVTDYIAPVAGEVAGIVSIDGAVPKKKLTTARVPVYISGKKAPAIAKAYISGNSASLTEFSKTRMVYSNAHEPLLRVIVNKTKGQTLEQVFADAWESLLSRNYRGSNFGHTNYMGGLLGQYGEYELEPYPMFDRLGIRREICAKEIRPRSKQVVARYLWYEYIPEVAERAGEKVVPLVVLLHGHNNDPRTQAECSGFLEIAAKEGFIVAELEWQGKGEYNYMDDDGIEVTIREILRRYPQIDPSRIYAEGMSAGGFAATALGIRKPYLFAAVGAHSGGMFTDKVSLGFPFQDNEGLWQSVRFLRGKVTMPYFSIGGTADEGVPFYNQGHPNGELLAEAWKAYLEYGGFEIPETFDTQKYPIFGIPLQNRRRIESIKRHAMETGDIVRDGKPFVRIVAVENFGHSNFVPGAALMWEFFRHWSRDQKTFESVWTD